MKPHFNQLASLERNIDGLPSAYCEESCVQHQMNAAHILNLANGSLCADNRNTVIGQNGEKNCHIACESLKQVGPSGKVLGVVLHSLPEFDQLRRNLPLFRLLFGLGKHSHMTSAVGGGRRYPNSNESTGWYIWSHSWVGLICFAPSCLPA